MIQDCYSKPPTCTTASTRASAADSTSCTTGGRWLRGARRDWIVDATRAVMEDPALAPDLLLTYLPHLDYDLQRHGPDHPKALAAADALATILRRAARRRAAHRLRGPVFGDYAIRACEGPAVLPEPGPAPGRPHHVRIIKGMAYPDFWYQRGLRGGGPRDRPRPCARCPRIRKSARGAGEALPGVERARPGSPARWRAWITRRSGDLVIVAAKGRWFAYPWWTDKQGGARFRHARGHPQQARFRSLRAVLRLAAAAR
jgi:hypothetical protein